MHIVQPETVLKWRRQGFRLLWRSKSRAKTRHPKIYIGKGERRWSWEQINGAIDGLLQLSDSGTATEIRAGAGACDWP